MKIIVKEGKHFLQGKQAEVAKVLLRTSKKTVPDGGLGWTLDKMADDASVIEGIRYRCKDCSCERQELEFGKGNCPECGSINIARIS
jgi:Zn finger protein HypA/HybF involved in hydrogenase expression